MISIVTVGMNHKKYLEALYGSLLECKPKQAVEAIYVDNCSTDGSVEWLRENYPMVKIVENKQPQGFGANNNLGVRHSKGDYIGIINPDIVFLDESLDRIVAFARQKEWKGIVCPQLFNPDGSIQYSVRKFATLSMMLRRWFSGENDDSDNSKVRHYLCKDIDQNKTQEIDWAIGAALFMSRDTYLGLDGFDERFFLYMEDEDLCLRAWEKNCPVIYYPEAKLIHNHLRRSTHISKNTLYHFRSLITFFRLHGTHYKRNSISDNL